MKQGNSLCLLAAGSFQHPRNWPQTRLNSCWEHLGSGSSGAVFPMRCPWLCYEEEPNYPKARSMLFYSRLDLFPRRTSGCEFFTREEFSSSPRRGSSHLSTPAATSAPCAHHQPSRQRPAEKFSISCMGAPLSGLRAQGWQEQLGSASATSLPAPGGPVHQQPSQACPAHPPFGVPLRRL